MVGSVYYRLAQYKQAKDHHGKALIIQRKLYGEEHADVATTYKNLVAVYHSLFTVRASKGVSREGTDQQKECFL